MRLSFDGAVVAFIALLSSAPASADSWIPPTRKIYQSNNHAFRLVVTPRQLSNPLNYFEDAASGKSHPGQQAGGQRSARGVLQRRDATGWAVVWDRPLANDVSPVDAVVSSSGRYVATLDNWHFMGLDKNVIVTYGADGSLLQSLQLSDILPDYYVKALPHSVSSIWWRGDAKFGPDDRLQIQIVIPAGQDLSKPARYVIVSIDPNTGSASPLSPNEWASAITKAKNLAAEVDAAEEERMAYFRKPLLGPSTNEESAWHQYLREAYFRTAADWKEDYPDTKVLRSPSAPDYSPSVSWLSDSLLEREMPADVIMIASPSSPENLIAVLREVVPKVRPDALKDARIYVAVPAEYRDQVSKILAPTGAKFIHLDPKAPIAQSAERLAEITAPTEQH